MVRTLLMALLPSAFVSRAAPPAGVPDYLPLFCRYLPYAETLWHPAPVGGYWGDGLSEGNGAIRGTSNLTLATALLVHAEDLGWLDQDQVRALARAGLDRPTRLARVRASWAYLAHSHTSGGGTAARDSRPWGRSWQSSLWVGASGLAALLTWDDLDALTRAAVERVVVDEATYRAGLPPRNSTPGNTAAEENGWDTHAPAVAVALFPRHPSAPAWLRAAQIRAANTYTVAADATSEARLGTERVRDVVCTRNLFADFTLDNHGFFHPSYLNVSGQELGEAWAMLAMGDRRHGTANALAFDPYARHHLQETWQVMRRLLLCGGEYAFPSGSDWALNVPSHQAYYAFVAGTLQDPVAAAAERRGLASAQRQAAAAPPGRLLAATNFEWWWEPIVLKRCAFAMMLLARRPPPEPAPVSALWERTETWQSDPTQILVHRTPAYFTSVSLRGQPMGLVVPLGRATEGAWPGVTPRLGSLLPSGTVRRWSRHDHDGGTAVRLEYADGGTAAMVALRRIVLWLANRPLAPLSVQNDSLVPGCGRQVRWVDGSRRVPSLQPCAAFTTAANWLSVDEELSLLSENGFRYEPAGGYTRRSAAEDRITPLPGEGGGCLAVLPALGPAAAADLARDFAVVRSEGWWTVRCRDGGDGPVVEARVYLGEAPARVAPVLVSTDGKPSPGHPLDAMTDGLADTFCVLWTAAGKGPTPETPIAVEFELPVGRAVQALRLLPRPGYGPRNIALAVRSPAGWEPVAEAHPIDQGTDLPLPRREAGTHYRLSITGSWDRGGAQDAPARNTQIAELALVSAAVPPAPARDVTDPVQVRVVAPVP